MPNDASSPAREAVAESGPSPISIPLTRWIVVGYFFWVGIFLGAVIMHAATKF